MKQYVIQRMWLLFNMVLLSMFGAYSIRAVDWINNPAISGDYIDEDINIGGTNTIIGDTRVGAVTRNVTLSVISDAIIQSNFPLTFFNANNNEIFLELHANLQLAGETTEFIVSFDSSSTTDVLPMQILFDSGTMLNLSPVTAALGGSTKFLANMSSTGTSGINFAFSSNNPTANATINVGANSYLGFKASELPDVSQETGQIKFQPYSDNAAVRMVLNIEDTGAVVLKGVLEISPGVIDFSVSAGKLANFVVDSLPSTAVLRSQKRSLVGPPPFSGLLVTNSNTVYPTLEIDPFCTGIVIPVYTGFVLGANGQLLIADGSYLDYVGLTLNTFTPTVPPNVLNGRANDSVVKDRNPSALIIDGSTAVGSTPAEIRLEGTSAIYFRSGVDNTGAVFIDPTNPVLSYTINPELRTPGCGNIVLDVEGSLVVNGDADRNSALNILSLHVYPNGGSVLINQNDTRFPLRSFLRDTSGAYLQYNDAFFFINNSVELHNTNLKHDDEIHRVFPKNDPTPSEPSYVGGDAISIACGGIPPRPAINFFNSNFLLHTSAALGGVDLRVPNDPTGDNLSNFIFYANGYVVDNGTGRNLILGTPTCAYAADGTTLISCDAHLDIIQETPQLTPTVQQLELLVSSNNHKVTEAIPVGANIAGQLSVHDIYLGCNSNISIGTNTTVTPSPFPLITTPTVFICGEFFAFDSFGGFLTQDPRFSGTTGQGGIYVDTNGILAVCDSLRADMNVVVSKSGNGIVSLPSNQVLFNPGMGISQWDLNLNDPSQAVVVSAGQTISDYTLDWMAVTKNFSVYTPYEILSVMVCGFPPLTAANLTAVPEIQGTVDQLQILRARLGDQPTIVINGGLVRELVFLPTPELPGDAPVGLIAIENDGILGFGTAERNVDSIYAENVLGVNGLQVAANGNGQLVLNEDTLINNAAHFLVGPDFGAAGVPQRLIITSAVPRELRVKSTGTLDLSAFSNSNQILTLAGQVRLVLEPGARVIMGGGILEVTDQAEIYADPYNFNNLLAGTTPATTDAVRVKITGTGTISLQDNSVFSIPRDSLVGIEADICCSDTLVPVPCCPLTDLTLELLDASQLNIGTDVLFGGGLQVGNTVNIPCSTISFRLLVEGNEAVVQIGSQGFLGISSGIVSKPDSSPDDWSIGSLFNVVNFHLDINGGTLRSNQIYPGTQDLANLIAVAPISGRYSINLNAAMSGRVQGGGNLFLLGSGIDMVNPIVDDVLTGNNGILASTALLTDPYKLSTSRAALDSSGSVADFFNYLSAVDLNSMSSPKGDFGPASRVYSRLGYIFTGLINRRSINQISAGNGSSPVPHTQALEDGAVSLQIDLNGTILNITELQG